MGFLGQSSRFEVTVLIKLVTMFSYINIHGSLSSIPQKLEIALHKLLPQMLYWENSFLQPTNVKFNPWILQEI
jgi:hypothetical protein